jgi:hypothetical protein
MVLLLADSVIRWQRQVALWDRQAWETRIVVAAVFLLVGATSGTTVFQVRRFKKTLTKPAR